MKRSSGLPLRYLRPEASHALLETAVRILCAIAAGSTIGALLMIIIGALPLMVAA